MNPPCPKCGGEMEAGIATAHGLVLQTLVPEETPRLCFRVLGERTSANPITALKQGLADEPTHHDYGVRGVRCSQRGFLELYATGEAIP
ncbi:MAG: hypothetical protein K8T25_17140 [Planctomycetia bacterium]|nr:hypothetical protein [Planctomycetia bacterium]